MALFDTLLRSERKASEPRAGVSQSELPVSKLARPRKCLGEELYILCDSRFSDLH